MKITQPSETQTSQVLTTTSMAHFLKKETDQRSDKDAKHAKVAKPETGLYLIGICSCQATNSAPSIAVHFWPGCHVNEMDVASTLY